MPLLKYQIEGRPFEWHFENRTFSNYQVDRQQDRKLVFSAFQKQKAPHSLSLLGIALNQEATNK